MTWPVVFHVERPPRLFEPFDEQAALIGVLYPWDAKRDWPVELSRFYELHLSQIRPPLALVLPRWFPDGLLGVDPWCTDSAWTSNPAGSWTLDCPWPLVDGQPAPLTITPSVHMVGSYHGFVTAGVIGDDLDGYAHRG